MFKKYRIVSKVRFIISIITLAIIIAVCCACIANIAGTDTASGSQVIEYKNVYVEDGDTLWSIAVKDSDNSTDIRHFIYEISELNDLDDREIHPGDIIKVPIKK